jgi:ABC-2 type transport system permease protein
MKNRLNTILTSKTGWIAILLILLAINFLASRIHYRFDLTKEKRYSLSQATKNLLRNLDEDVRIEVFLKGDFPAGFRKLANSVDEFLQECTEYSRGKLKVKFTNPLKDLSDSAAAYFRDSIEYFYDIPSYTLQAPGKVGDEMNIKQIIPGALIQYKDTVIGVNLLKGAKTFGTEPEQLAALYNNVEATLEFRFASAIQKITSEYQPLIGYTLGHGEAWGYNVDDAVRTLYSEYRFDTVNLKTDPYIPAAVDAVVMLKPTQTFSDAAKLKLDQYLMNGGKLFCMVDVMFGEIDSLYRSGGFIAFDRGLNLDDLFFRYGVRINKNLLQDMQCDKLPQVTGDQSVQQQRLVDWPFFPVLNGTNHPISKNLDGVRAIFPNTMDTVRADGIKKTFLLRSSPNARVLETPARVDFEFMQIAPDIRLFNMKEAGVAVLLEGKFRSLFDGRISRTDMDSLQAWGMPFKKMSDRETQIIVVADGDIATNMYSQFSGPLPMGMNLFTRYTFANKDFYTHAIEYLVNPSGILETRAKDFTLRLLNLRKVKEQRSKWQLINIVLPVLLVIISGAMYQQVRRNKFADKFM